MTTVEEYLPAQVANFLKGANSDYERWFTAKEIATAVESKYTNVLCVLWRFKKEGSVSRKTNRACRTFWKWI